ncbi:MAG: M4 family metallopeptidase, partial [Acidimicrobiales bacterium]
MPIHTHRPRRAPIACIVPPDLLRDIIRGGNEEERGTAADTMAVDQTFRTLRAAFAATVAATHVAMRPMGGMGGSPQRTIYDQKNSNAIALGTIARTEGGRAVKDPAVNEAYDGFGATYKFFWEVFARNSIDSAGMPLLGLVHYSANYANAFWDGQGHMFFGDGDGQLF